MIKLFSKTDTIFGSNGDKIIKPLKAVVHKEDNGSFYLDLETDLSYVNDIIQGRIVVAPTPQGEQAFRISNVEKEKRKITTRCYHVFYDSEQYMIEDSYVDQRDCNYALDHLNSATDIISPFTTLSDVDTISSFRCVRKSLYEAISVVLERWGGHLVRNNFNIQIRKEIGQDNGVIVRYAKNLEDITSEEDWSDVVTKLLPVGKDGTMLNDVDPSEDIYVYSSIQYETPYTKTASFDQDNIVEEDYINEQGILDETAYKTALVNDLRHQAQLYVDNACIPQINYTIKANIDKISDIGDVIHVDDYRLKISVLTNLISYDYDAISELYKKLEFGNFKQSLSDLMNTINASAEELLEEASKTIEVTLNKELQEAKSQIWGALGNSYVIYEGDKILIVDNLPKETARNVIMLNSAGIAFSNNGINGDFITAWTIDGTFNAQAINVINFSANLIKGGTLKLGSNLNEYGQLEVYNETNALIGLLNKDGLKMYGQDGSYVLMNNEVGFAGYDRYNNKIYWVSKDEFHMKKSVVEEEITLCNKLRFIPITIWGTDYFGDPMIINDGIGLVSVSGGDNT